MTRRFRKKPRSPRTRLKRDNLRKGIYILPNLFTSAGLFAGFYSIIATMNGDFKRAEGLIRKFKLKYKQNAYTNLIRLINDKKHATHDRMVAQQVLAAYKTDITDRPTRFTRQVIEALELDLSLDTDAMDVPALIRILNGKDEALRADAAKALGGKKDRDAVPALLHALSSKHYRVRVESGRALGKLKAGDATEPLVKLLDDPIDAAMVRSINDVGHVMGKEIIAEAVESDQVLAKLEGIGVDYAQGFALGRPRTIDDLASVEFQIFEGGAA